MDETEQFRPVLVKACDRTLARLRDEGDVPSRRNIRAVEQLRAALEAESSAKARAS